MTAALGDRVLEWMLRRLGQGVRVEHDLVLVHDSPALAGVGPTIDVRGEPWRVARATGELTLRDVLPEADRLVAIVPTAFPPLPMDIASRTYLGRVLDPRAEDVVAAASGRFCEALIDDGLIRAVFDSLDTLRATAGSWSLGDLVTARELRTVLVGAELGAARLDRERDWELLARWILEGAPRFRAVTLVRSALEEAQPRTGAWLAWALTDGSLPALCAAGALLASDKGAAAAPTIPGLATGDRSHLVDLVDSALREVWRQSPLRAREVLADAERAARGLHLDAGKHRLLRVPLDGALSHAATLAAEGRPLDDAAVEGLRRNLHAGDVAEGLALVADLGRLARFERLVPPTEGTTAWISFAARNVAWADLAWRRVRRSLETAPPWLADPGRKVVSRFVAARDSLNRDFARTLASDWSAVTKNTDARQPLALHQLGRSVIRRLVDDGTRVFLLVLDGCDYASFLEVLESIPAGRRIGLALPEVHSSTLRDDLTAMGALGAAVSLVPTVTAHSRRALFAGEIPGNVALDDAEAAAPNATADKAAWERNSSLGALPRKLFLKGDLGATGQPLLDALRQKDARLVAAVYNGVDDALSSKETTSLPSWTFGSLGTGAADVVQVAVEEGWCVLVTADHGHTPFVATNRKAGVSGLGHRVSDEPVEEGVTFRSGPLPRQPLHLLVRFGAWLGHQRRGFHGGAGIEEVVVPLAFLGRVRGEQEGRPRAPGWWWTSDGTVVAAPVPVASPPAATAVQPVPTVLPSQPGDPDPHLGELTADERIVLALLRENGEVRLTDIVRHIGKAPMRAAGMMQALVRKLFDLGSGSITSELLPDNDRMYRYQATEPRTR